MVRAKQQSMNKETIVPVNTALDGEILDGRHHQGVRVYYEDTDFSQRVYHASYLRFMMLVMGRLSSAGFHRVALVTEFEQGAKAR